MNAVPGECALELAAIAKIDRHFRHRSNRLPVQDKSLAQYPANFLIGIQSRAEETAVGATEFIGQFAEQPQRQDRLARLFCRGLGLVQIGVPEEF